MESLDALPLVLCHPAAINQQLQLVCTLLCTSKGLREAVAGCAGQVPVSCVADNLQAAWSFAAWIAQHGNLMKHLSLRLDSNTPGAASDPIAAKEARCEQEAAIAAGLHQCGLKQQLLLQSCELAIENGSLLQQLACCSHLTSLVLHVPNYNGNHGPTITNALANLTTLQSLELLPWPQGDRYNYTIIDSYLPGLSTLVQLGKLVLHSVHGSDGLQDLPHQLVKLTVNTARGSATGMQHWDLDMGRMAALKELCGTFTVAEHDVLPPQLRSLTLWDCSSSVWPILQLRQLQQLTITSCTTSPQVLQQLGSSKALLGLQELNLSYGSSNFEAAGVAGDEAVAAWAGLPIKSLDIVTWREWQEGDSGGGSSLSAAGIEQMARLQGLTCLLLESSVIVRCAQQLAVTLQQLTQLSRLRLYCQDRQRYASFGLGDEEASITAADVAMLMVAAAGLPLLRCLEVQLPLGEGAGIEQLAAATQLTSLGMYECGLVDSTVSVIANRLPGLQKLDLSMNCALTAAAVAVVAKQLLQLTELSLMWNHGVSFEGVQQLSHLQQLKVLNLWGTGVSVEAKMQALCMDD